MGLGLNTALLLNSVIFFYLVGVSVGIITMVIIPLLFCCAGARIRTEVVIELGVRVRVRVRVRARLMYSYIT